MEMLSIKQSPSFRFIDIFITLGIILQGAGNFGILPLNVAQIIILCVGVILIFECICTKIVIAKSELLLIVYMCIVTFIGEFDFECVKGLGFFSIQLLVLGIFYRKDKDIMKICKIIYMAAYLLALYGMIQEIGYLLRIPALYDISLYGFTKNGNYITSFGLMRIMSFYAEPSELSTIFAAGILIGLVGNDKNYPFCGKRRTLLIGVAALLTMSFVVYVSIAVTLFYYVGYYQKSISKKIMWGIFIAFIVLAVACCIPGILGIITEKVLSLKSGSSTQGSDLSAFALYSNIRVAFEKMKSGYLFGTGYDTHRLYYFDYIEKLYSSVIMYANVDEASSLYTRIFSEFGVVGIIAYIVFLVLRFRKYVKRKEMVLTALVVVLFVSGIRNGHYVDILKMLVFTVVLNNRRVEPCHDD